MTTTFDSMQSICVDGYEVARSVPSGVVAFGVGVRIRPDGQVEPVSGKRQVWHEQKTLGLDGVK